MDYDYRDCKSRCCQTRIEPCRNEKIKCCEERNAGLIAQEVQALVNELEDDNYGCKCKRKRYCDL